MRGLNFPLNIIRIGYIHPQIIFNVFEYLYYRNHFYQGQRTLKENDKKYVSVVFKTNKYINMFQNSTKYLY